MLEGGSESQKRTRQFEKEREFHQGRWESKAQADVQRGIWRRLLERNRTDKTAEDFMREEADRDNADFDKRQLDEFKEWQDMLRVVIDNLKEKIRNPENKDAGGTLVLILGGGMKSAYGAGQVLGLHMVGLTADKVEMVGGSSGGAVDATAYAGGLEQILRGCSMMVEELGSKDFISKIRLGKLVNLPMLKGLMEEGEYAIDTEAIRKTPTELRFTMTLPVEGQQDPQVRILDAKTMKPGMVDGIVSTMSIPNATGPIPEIDGVKYYDGGFVPLPIDEYIEEYTRSIGAPPKNILILPQTPFEEMENIRPTNKEIKFADLLRKQAGSLTEAGSLGNAALLSQIEKGLLLKHQLRESLEIIQKRKDVNIGILWPPDMGLGSLTIDGDDMKAAILESARAVIREFGQKQPDEMPWYISERGKLRNAIRNFQQAA
ncbi:MAG: hypothetical protein Q8P19_01180 [bacterium]|nr:hypothetical protein [bacterium]